MKNHCQDISNAAIALTREDRNNVAKILLYCEVQDGFSSVSTFCLNKDGHLRFFMPTDYFDDMIYEFWDNWRKQPENREWRAMEFVIENGKFSVDFTYPDQLDDTDAVSSRRPEIERKHFGDVEVDYSELD